MALGKKIRAFTVASFATWATFCIAISSESVATTIVPDGTEYIVSFNEVFATGTRQFSAGDFVNDDYLFELPDLNASGNVGTEWEFAVLNPDPGLANLGIANLTFSIEDTTNSNNLFSVAFTDVNGDINAFGPAFSLIFPAPIDFVLSVTGEVLSGGGAYSAALAAVPVPPAALLFGTALVGMGFLSRRRRRKAAQAA